MKNASRLIALATAFTLSAAAIPTFAASTPPSFQDQDHHDQDHHDQDHHDQRDYSHDRYYRLGNREGYHDYRRHTHRTEHNHGFTTDEQRQAHDYGYQQGLHGRRGYHPDFQDHQDPH